MGGNLFFLEADGYCVLRTTDAAAELGVSVASEPIGVDTARMADDYHQYRTRGGEPHVLIGDPYRAAVSAADVTRVVQEFRILDPDTKFVVYTTGGSLDGLRFDKKTAAEIQGVVLKHTDAVGELTHILSLFGVTVQAS